MQDANSWVNALAGSNPLGVQRQPQPQPVQRTPVQHQVQRQQSLIKGGPSPFQGGQGFGGFSQIVNPAYQKALQQATAVSGPPVIGAMQSMYPGLQAQLAVKGIPQYLGYGAKPANAPQLEAHWNKILRPVQSQPSTQEVNDTNFSNYFGG